MNNLNRIRIFLGNNSIKSRTGNAIIFGFIGAGVSKICILLIGIILSNILGQELYGKYSLVNSTIQTFVTFASMGIGSSLVRYTAAYRENDKEKCGKLIGTLSFISIIMSIIISFIVFIAAGNISQWVNGNNELEFYFRIASVIIFLIAVSSLSQSILLGYECNDKIAKNEIIYGFFSIFIISFAAWYYDVIGALVGMVFAKLLSLLLMYYSAKRESCKNNIKWTLKFDKIVQLAFANYAFPAFVSSILVLPVTWILNSLLVKNAGYNDLAVYAVATQWVTIITYITQLFTRVKPIYVELYENNDMEQYKKLLFKMMGISSAFGLPIAILGMLGAKYIMRMYGESYISGYPVFMIMMTAAVFITLQSQFGAVFESMGKMWYGFAVNILWAINLMGLFSWLIKYGALGYSIAYLVSYILHCIYSWIIIVFLLKRRENK